VVGDDRPDARQVIEVVAQQLAAGPNINKIEYAFAQLGRWRRLSRCYEGTEASATAWLQVASVGYLLGRA
jgi:transposase